MVFFPSLQSIGGTSVTYTTTNYTYGGGTVSTNFLNLTLPALMTTNSMVGVMAMGDRTNAITANVYWDIVLGTNLCTASGTVGSTTTPRAVAGYTNPYGIEVFRNNGSFTQQIVNAPSAALTGSQTVPYDPASYVDTSAPWNMTVGLLPNVNATPSTNILIREFMLVERWIQ